MDGPLWNKQNKVLDTVRHLVANLCIKLKYFFLLSIAKNYDFMMGNINTNPFKIAQVIRRFQGFFENNSYFINIGPNVDIAFICMCAYAIDELFSDDN